MVIKDTPLTYVFDLDGVIYRGMELMPSARETLATLRKNGNNVWFFTNNAALSRKSYVEKLAKLDIPSTTNQIMTSAYATALHMEEIGAVGKTAYMIGGEGIKEELELIGMKVLADDEEPDAKIDYVVVGIDRAISYNKIARAQQSIFDGAEFIATNADASYPSDGGKILPGAGCMVAAVKTASNTHPFVVGKPNTYAFEEILKLSNTTADKTIMIGDRLDTDMLLANAVGAHSVLVLTGVNSREDVEKAGPEYKPDRIIETLAELI